MLPSDGRTWREAGMLSLDGSPLDRGRITRVARFGEPVSMTSEAWARVAAAHRAAERAAGRGPVYGRNTGVGANRDVAAGVDGHGRRLLRSHAAAGGAPLPEDAVRAMLVVRINQIAVGGSGVSPRTTRALLRMLNTGALPEVREHGGVGTGDLAALAGTGLALLGERPASAPWVPMGRFPGTDALALVSSNALTIGRAALVVADLEPLMRVATVTTALSALACRANPEAFSAEAARAAVAPGAATVARDLRELMGPVRPARVQDSFGFRAAPQVQGVVVDALADLAAHVGALTATAQENPLVVGEGVVHHGGFHMAALTLRLDALRLALAQAAPALLGRLRALSDPEVTRLPAFLATGSAGSSGTMIVEYTAASAYGVLRAAAAPASLETVVLSRGAEEDASFAPLAVRQSETATTALRTLLACELLTSLRALAMRGSDTAVFHRAWHAFRAQGGGDADTDDRDLQADLDAAERALPQLGAPPVPRSDPVPERSEASGF
ncbi:aromatic amino acid lyase [Nocardiopsis sp. NPDC058789]|uniref:aromatic amino acid lyase n=1 Tax=Nocardiopsis sp. NPDC058789 TaxID=3346634 RepID=UPI00366AA726